jgi:uncharacterized protein (DUF58 family)
MFASPFKKPPKENTSSSKEGAPSNVVDLALARLRSLIKRGEQDQKPKDVWAFGGWKIRVFPALSLYMQLKCVIAILIFGLFYLFAGETSSEWIYLLTAAVFAVISLGVILPLFQIIDAKTSVFVPGEAYAGEKVALEVLISHAIVKGVWCRVFPLRWLRLRINLANQSGKITEGLIHPAAVDYVGDAESVYVVSEPLKRGVYRFDSLEAASCFPFTMAWWLGKVSATLLQKSLSKDNGQLTVYPILMPMRGRFLQTLGASGELSGRLTERNRTSQASASVRGLRDYRSGDSPRWVHWRSYARTGKLVVKEFDSESSPKYFISFDTFANWRTEEQFELAVCLANSLMHCESELLKFELLVPPSEETNDVWGMPPGIQRSRELLARVQAHGDAPLADTQSEGQGDVYQRIETVFAETLKKHPGGVMFSIVPGGSSRVVNLLEATIDKSGRAGFMRTRSSRRPKADGDDSEGHFRGKVVARVSHLEQITMV